ncbi:KTSC domain-containing protein [Lutibaculum baratangense]|uniref:KTSC domain-containing protein n=1 Tax=Lutibaculum baratangense AMV1 TaxID=631454 RepID=V4RSC4_9HYPH|nr:KTSC domain-containing protein [Lutibaculum baratangense]ESR26035.1 hypothetical protein N177_1370 [Lutibaculum baratangense AMV1]
MPEIDSSVISQVEHDPQSQVLTIWFHDGGRRYDYFRVPREVYEALLEAPSAGAYYSEHIKDTYKFRRLR